MITTIDNPHIRFKSPKMILKHHLTQRQLCDLELLLYGVYLALTSFLNHIEKTSLVFNTLKVAIDQFAEQILAVQFRNGYIVQKIMRKFSDV